MSTDEKKDLKEHQVGFRLDALLYNRVNTYAKATNRSRSNAFQTLVSEALEVWERDYYDTQGYSTGTRGDGQTPR